MRFLLVLFFFLAPSFIGVYSHYLEYLYWKFLGCKYTRNYLERVITTQEIKMYMEAKFDERKCAVHGVIGQQLAFRMLPTAIHGESKKPRAIGSKI